MMEFLDKIYSNDKLFAMVYIIGAILLLVFIIMLIVSLKKPKRKKINSKILDEPKVTTEEVKTVESTTTLENVEVKPVETNNEEIKPLESNIEPTIIPTTEAKEEPSSSISVEEVVNNVEPEKESSESENSISKALENVENKDIINSEPENTEPKVSLSSEIPDVDEYVDNVVKKTYEKNEQFSSVYVGNNTSTIKLDKVLEDLNVDDDIKVDIVPEDEKTVVVEEAPLLIEEPIKEENEEIKTETPEIDPNVLEGRETNQEVEEEIKEESVKENSLSNLDDLKKAMEDKKKEVNEKQDELKAKLAGLKTEKKDDVMKAEDLLNKLNAMKKE